jgi:hypothetical protein
MKESNPMKKPLGLCREKLAKELSLRPGRRESSRN